MDDRIKYALRLAREIGGEAKEEMIERAEWNPFRGLKIKPPAEKLSSEPDIREYQLKRHAHEFEGAPEPVAPTRKVVVDAPLFGGKKELGELPYDYAGMANTALNAIYGLKTAPLYTNPYTAPVGRALDAYELAKKVEQDPSALSSYSTLPKLFKGATPFGLGAAGVGAAVSASDEDEEEPIRKSFGGPAGTKTPEQEEEERRIAVQNAYNTYLGRAPDVAGQAYWMGQLQAGFAPQNLSTEFQAAPEGQVYAADLGRAFQTAYGRAPREAMEAFNWVNAYRQANPVTLTENSRVIPTGPLPNWNPNIVASDLPTPPFNPVLNPSPVTPALGTGAGTGITTPNTGGSLTTTSNPLPNWNPLTGQTALGVTTPGIGSGVIVPSTTTGAGAGVTTPTTGGSPTTPDNRTELPVFNPNIPTPDMRAPGLGENVIVPGTTTGAGSGVTTPVTGGTATTPDNRNEIPVWNPNIGRSDLATPPIAPPLEQLASNQIIVDPKDHTSFVTSLYNTYLGRAPDVEGQQYFQSFLAQGGSPAELAQAIATSPEAQMNNVGSMYQYILGREGDQGGIDAFRNEIAAGRMDLSDVGQMMMQSPEYQAYMDRQFEAAKSGFNEVNPYDFAATALKGVGERGPMPDGYRDPNVWGVSESNDVFPTSFASTLLNKGLGQDQQLQAGYIDPNVMLSGRDNVSDKYQFAVTALKNGLGENGIYQPYVDASINAQKVNDQITNFNPDDPNSFVSGVYRALTNSSLPPQSFEDLKSRLSQGLISPKEAAAEIGQSVNAPLPPARPSDAELQEMERKLLSPQISRSPIDVVKDIVKGVVRGATEGFKRITGIGKNPELDYQRKVAIEREAEQLGIDPADLAAAMLYESIGSLDPNRKGMPDNRKGSVSAIKQGAVPRFMGLIQFGAREQLDYGVKPNMTFDEQMRSVGKFLKERGLKTWLEKHPNATAEEKRAALYSTINAGGPDKSNWGKTDASAGGKPTTVWQKSHELVKNYGNRAQEIMATTAPPGMAVAETPEDVEAPTPPVRPEEILQPNIGGGSGSVINMGPGFGGVGIGGSGEASPGAVTNQITGGGGHVTTPISHTPSVPHTGTTHTGGITHTGGLTHTGGHPSTHTGSFSVGFAPDAGAVHHGGNFSDYASTHGFGHTTVGQHYVPYNPIALPGAGGFSHGHHGASHHGGQGGYWDPNWANSSMHSGGDQSFFKSGGAVKPDDAVKNALRLANKRLKGGKINTKIDRDPDWDMALRRGGSARG